VASRRRQGHRYGVPAWLVCLASYPLLSFTRGAERPDNQIRRALGRSAKHYMSHDGILMSPRGVTRTQRNDLMAAEEDASGTLILSCVPGKEAVSEGIGSALEWI
jgi:hypothetical protein